jgi:hypothetical protein
MGSFNVVRFQEIATGQLSPYQGQILRRLEHWGPGILLAHELLLRNIALAAYDRGSLGGIHLFLFHCTY